MISTKAYMQEGSIVADYPTLTLAHGRVQSYFPYSMPLDVVTNQSRLSSVASTRENNTEVVELLETVV